MFRILLAAIGATFVLGVLAPVIHHATGHNGLRYLMLRFDPGQEANLPTWLASFLLLTASASVFLNAALRHLAGERDHLLRWYLLAGIVLVAAIDETAGFHELLTPATKRFIETTGFFDNAWMIPVGVALIVGAIIYLPWLVALPRQTAKLVVAAGLLFVGGAMVFEGLGSLVLDHIGAGGWSYSVVVAAEEALENLGTATFILAMLGLLAQRMARVTLHFEPPAGGRI